MMSIMTNIPKGVGICDTGVYIELPCNECGGSGYVSNGHPIDPSSQEVECEHCNDDGSVFVADPHCHALGDAMLDYPNAKSVRPL